MLRLDLIFFLLNQLASVVYTVLLGILYLFCRILYDDTHGRLFIYDLLDLGDVLFLWLGLEGALLGIGGEKG